MTLEQMQAELFAPFNRKRAVSGWLVAGPVVSIEAPEPLRMSGAPLFGPRGGSYWASDEGRESISARSEAMWSRPGFRAKRSRDSRKAWRKARAS